MKEQNEVIEREAIKEHHTLERVSPEMISKAIDKLNNGKAADALGLTSENLKYAKDELTEPLADIVNDIYDDLDFPDMLKSGTLTPVHKKGKNKLLRDSYRGI